MTKVKNNKGITLIALVITIIVLLILAGVTIAALTGDNGILDKSTEAKEKTVIGKEIEQVKLSAMAAINTDGFLPYSDFKIEMEKYSDVSKVEEAESLDTNYTLVSKAKKVINLNNLFMLVSNATDENPNYAKVTYETERIYFVKLNKGTNDDPVGSVYEDEDSIEKTTHDDENEEDTKYTVIYNSNRGEGKLESQKGEINEKVVIKENGYTRQGYNFAGWNTDARGNGTSYEENTEITLSEDITLYAQWQAISCIGYYADTNGDEEIDGVIFADLGVGTTGSGQWYNSDGAYSIPIGDNVDFKNYNISQEKYDGAFGQNYVVTPTDEGSDRFYVMSLSDFSEERHNWYYSAQGVVQDPFTTTSRNFGKGKENTEKMIVKWNNQAYGAKNGGDTYKDMWGEIQNEVDNGWFVPSREEWSAFVEELGVTKSNYTGFELKSFYWASSMNDTYYVHVAMLSNRASSYRSL